MNKYLPKILAALVPLLAFSCSSGNKTELAEGFYAISLPTQDKEKTIHLSRVADSIAYIPLETTDSCKIENIWKVVPTKDYLVIMDRKTQEHVYLFTREGKFVREISSKGTAENQYAFLNDVTADPETNTIYILDGARRVILEFSPQDSLLSKTPTLFYVENFQLTGGKTFALNTNYNKSKYLPGATPALILMNLSEGVIGRYMVRPQELDPTYLIGLRSNFSPTKDGATFIAPLCDTIFLAGEKEARPLYLADFGNDNEAENQKQVESLLKEKPAVYSLEEQYRQMDKVFMTGFYAFDDVAMITYSKLSRNYVAFFYPESGKVIDACTLEPRITIPVGNDMDGLTVFSPLGSEGNRMYCYTTLGLSDNTTALSPEAEKAKAAYKPGDNPVLSVVTLKAK